MKNTTSKELKEARGELNRLRELFYSTKFEAGAMTPTAQQRYFTAYIPFDTKEFTKFIGLKYHYIFLLCDHDPIQALEKWEEWVNSFVRDSELMRCEFYDKIPKGNQSGDSASAKRIKTSTESRATSETEREQGASESPSDLDDTPGWCAPIISSQKDEEVEVPVLLQSPSESVGEKETVPTTARRRSDRVGDRDVREQVPGAQSGRGGDHSKGPGGSDGSAQGPRLQGPTGPRPEAREQEIPEAGAEGPKATNPRAEAQELELVPSPDPGRTGNGEKQERVYLDTDWR